MEMYLCPCIFLTVGGGDVGGALFTHSSHLVSILDLDVSERSDPSWPLGE